MMRMKQSITENIAKSITLLHRWLRMKTIFKQNKIVILSMSIKKKNYKNRKTTISNLKSRKKIAKN